jgi:aromatic ring hydroxylase
MAAKLYARSIELLRLIGASGLIMHPSEYDLLGNAGEGTLRYFAAGNHDADTHIQLLKLAGDLAVGDFGGRQLLYEQFYLGAPKGLQSRFFQSYLRIQGAEQLVETLLVQSGAPSNS